MPEQKTDWVEISPPNPTTLMKKGKTHFRPTDAEPQDLFVFVVPTKPTLDKHVYFQLTTATKPMLDEILHRLEANLPIEFDVIEGESFTKVIKKHPDKKPGVGHVKAIDQIFSKAKKIKNFP